MARHPQSPAVSAPIRLGMVGGGEGAFIGAVHRYAARLDGHFHLVAGALSSTPVKARRSGLALGLAEDRIYSDYAEMARAEAARPDGIEAVAIVTPNHLHVPVAAAFLKAGIHVICDKPLSHRLADARRLQAQVERSGLVFALTHHYTGYPMLRQAREMVQSGQLGEVRVVQVEYPQDWLAEPVEQGGQKQAAWRTDPQQAGGGAIGDIGSHAWQIADFVTGLPVEAVCAEVSSFVPGRAVDDDVQVLLRYAGGARGMLWASQVAVGHVNDLKLRVFGSQGGLAWSHTRCDELHWTPLNQPTRILQRGTSAAGALAGRATRVPGGHPEGFLEAFATVYSEAAAALRERRPGAPKRKADPLRHFPTIGDGVRGVAFIDAVLRSGRAGGRWTKVAA